jgi:superfamily II DNA or RNA helicase
MDSQLKSKILHLTNHKSFEEIKSFLETLPKGDKGPFFEWYISKLYQGNGWITVISGRKNDKGADVLLYHPDSPQKVTQIIQAKNFKRPITFDETRTELTKFEEQCSIKYNCNQFRIVSINGYVKNAYSLEEWNIDLVDWQHIKHLIECFKPDQNIKPEIDLFPHNRHTYESVISLLQTNKSVAIAQATGTGKSYLIAKLMIDFINEPKLLLAPSNYILEQQLRIIPWMRNATLMTYAKGMNLSEQEIEDIEPNLVILDEFHRCGALEWGKGVQRILETYPESKVVGTSATPVRYLDDNRDMSQELFEGRQVSNLTLVDAIARKILPEPNYVSALYTLDEEIQDLTEKINSKDIKLQEKEKVDILNEIKQAKIDWEKTSGVPEILKKHLPPEVNKVIVFCKNQKHLDEMEVEVSRWFQKARTHRFRSIYKTFAEYPGSDEEFENFKQSKDKDTIHLLFAIDKLNEGIHIPEVGAVILLRPTESPIIFYQQIGRCLQVNSDHKPIIFDFVNNFRNIKANDFTNDLEEAIENIQGKRHELGLKPYKFDIHIGDETSEIQDILGTIRERIEPWEVGFNFLQKFVKENHHSRVPRSYKTKSNFNLGNWAKHQRDDKKKGKLSTERIRLLQSMPGWTWDILGTIWLEGLDHLKEYIEMNHHSRVPASYKTKSKFNLGIFVSRHRKDYKIGRLSEERIEFLESLPGWAWDAFEGKWEAGLEHLKEYMKENNHSRVPQNYKTKSEFSLGSWVSARRKDYKDGRLSEERIEFLESLPRWTWDILEADWLEGLDHLKEYIEMNHHSTVPRSYKTKSGFNLGVWVSTRRNQKKENILSAERIQTLESLKGWTWGALETAWLEGLQHLTEYVNEEGHSRVPQNYKTKSEFRLGSWVSHRRGTYKNGILSVEQIRVLESLPGWAWDASEGKWEEGLDHLKEYIEVNHHSRVPQRYKTKSKFNLGTWIGSRRAKYKKGKLSEEQIKVLESLPEWTWDPYETDWLEGFEHLQEYIEVNHHSRVPQRYKTKSKFNLGSWVGSRRKNYKNGILSEEQIKVLESLPGWTWDLLETNWLEGFEHLKKYAQEVGHSRVPDKYKTKAGYNLGTWVSNRRTDYKADRISEDRIKSLESLPGWAWDARKKTNQ